MSSFFSQPDNVPQPAPTGVSTREQFAPATGATPSPQPANTPQVGKGQGAGQAPQYTNLKDFLSGQSAGQVDSEVNPLTDKANKLAGDTQTAANKASSATAASTTAGVDNGGVFSNPATSGTPSSGGTPTTGVAKLAPTLGNKIGLGGPTLDSPTSGTVTPTAAASGPTASATSGDPSYDFSKVNLAGYQGPSTGDVQGAFGGAQSASALAQANATQLASGTPTYNAFDNAAITTNPGAWSKLQASLTGENQAVANAGAQQAGAVQGVAQAQQASDNSAAQQKSDLGTISGSAASTAAHTAATLTSLSGALASGDSKTVEGALADPALAGVGLDSATAGKLREELSQGTLSLAQVQTALQPYIAAAKTSSGYTASGASTFNQANKLLGTGATASVSAPVTGPQIQTAQPAADNSSDLATAKAALAKVAPYDTKSQTGVVGGADAVSADAQNQRAGAAIKDLLSKGYTPDQLAGMLGIPATRINQLSNDAKFALTNNSIAGTAAAAARSAGKK